jgi:transcriptional regulator with XRE-family HTH domain
MITAAQGRAARAVLKWSQIKTAEESGVAIAPLKRFEEGGSVVTRPKTIEALEAAFARAGVVFLPATDDRGEGVCLAKSV